jgi:hypothetical protein
MEPPQTGYEILEREFLPTRAKILEIAATLDRIARAGDDMNDPRLGRIREAVKLLLEPGDDRAERVQLLFSRLYEENWREQLEIPTTSSMGSRPV